MSDELNVWTFEGCSMPSEVRSAEYVKGYQQAIADVVEWLESVGKEADEILPNGGTVARRFAREATRRFGKDA